MGRMMDIDRFQDLAEQMSAELPEEFFQELNGGIVIEEEAKPDEEGEEGDLYVLGEYVRDGYLGRQFVLYYGSFVEMFPLESEMKREIRATIRHEFRHHLESLANLRDLEIEDAEFMEDYLREKEAKESRPLTFRQGEESRHGFLERIRRKRDRKKNE